MFNSINNQLYRIPPLILIGLTSIAVVTYYSFNDIYSSVFRFAINSPFIRTKISEKRSKLKDKFKESNKNQCKDLAVYNVLPDESVDPETLQLLLESHGMAGDIKCYDGFASGCIYTMDPNLSQILTIVFKHFEHSNPLHMDLFPGLRKMETEVVQMISRMFNGDNDTVGTVTSGGSESLILAVKTYRDYKSMSKTMNIIAPNTIHPAVLKACHYFNVNAILIPVDKTSKLVSVKSILSAITDQTCAIFMSAPNYPYGLVDPIKELCEHLSKLGSNIPVHVDSCLGGFVVPFLNHLELFDFRIPQVTSISCDVHKYGLAPKGTSVIVYRHSYFLESQVFACTTWPGGIYATANITGSRSGLLIAACWATMLKIGNKNYKLKANKLYLAAIQLASDISKIDGFTLMCNVEANIVAATCKNCYAYLDQMRKKGWYLCALQDPPGFHIALTELHLVNGMLDKFIDDSKMIQEELKTHGVAESSDIAMLYGTNQTLPDRSIVEDIAKDYIVASYES